MRTIILECRDGVPFLTRIFDYETREEILGVTSITFDSIDAREPKQWTAELYFLHENVAEKVFVITQ